MNNGLIDSETAAKMKAQSEELEWLRLLKGTSKLWELADWNPAEYQRRIAFYKADPL